MKIELDLPPKLVRGLRKRSNALGVSIDAYAAEMLSEDEITPRQRRAIDARLAEGLDDLKRGRCYGPFSTHEELMAFLRNQPREKAKRSSG